ncbi:hypothetical protein B0T22DRAFT_467818 [Podospora appendiculata]|uniref:Uncharacterized protein n=1 Tax=Podospora appendiculata TaxID=314037 RepID=A0AAE0X275_9PEZI|nr:hypothetical protein B0T22DRAFT_467818 [Podospora appendiculata]
MWADKGREGGTRNPMRGSPISQLPPPSPLLLPSLSFSALPRLSAHCPLPSGLSGCTLCARATRPSQSASLVWGNSLFTCSRRYGVTAPWSHCPQSTLPVSLAIPLPISQARREYGWATAQERGCTCPMAVVLLWPASTPHCIPCGLRMTKATAPSGNGRDGSLRVTTTAAVT